MSNYILDGRTPVECNSILEWGKWFEEADRHVAKTVKNDIQISTVFLGIDHSFGGGLPLLFETMIFGGEHDEYQQRYSTWEDAENGHAEACKFAGVEYKKPKFYVGKNEGAYNRATSGVLLKDV